MKQTTVFRITGEICFYFAVLCVFSVLRAWVIPMAAFAAACLGLGFVIVQCKNAALRGVLAILPGLCFLMGPFRPMMAFPMVALVYYVLVMAQGNYAMPLDEYRRSFTAMLVICLFFLAANIANSTVYYNQVISAESLAFSFAFLLLGITAMRRMQMGAEMTVKLQVRNALSVVGVPILAVGVSVLLFFGLRYSQIALSAVLKPVGRFLIWLFHKLFPTGAPLEEMSLQEYLKPETSILPLELEFDMDGTTSPVYEEKIDFARIPVERAAEIGAWVALGLLLLLALYIVIRHARRTQDADSEEEMALEEGESGAARQQGRKKKKARMVGNARQLRRIYKTYLDYRRARGLKVNSSDTSEEILNREQILINSEDAKKLRELYIAARYGDPSAVTRAQVLDAQACLERIVEQKV